MEEAYARVGDALGQKPGESLLDAAKRLLLSSRAAPMWPVAHIVSTCSRLPTSEEKWRAIFRAARVADRVEQLHA